LLQESLAMSVSRRKFVSRTTLGVIGAAALPGVRKALAEPVAEKPLIVSTWPFGKASNDVALRILLAGGPLLDAVEQGVWVTELDVNNKSVGLHGTPNAAGVAQLDSCIMFGPGHKAGSVAALEGIVHPISAARRVMEKTKHVMLVGEGARMFALEQGLESVEVHAVELYQKWRVEHPEPAPRGHDTLALLVLGADGNIAGGCSTSGLGGKQPGRVGDSPILGSGLYVDNEVGAAGATGVGENVMRYCASFQIVELMRQGLHPTEACRRTIQRIIRSEAASQNLSINFVALNKDGQFGAAGTNEDFAYSVATKSASQVLPNPALVK